MWLRHCRRSRELHLAPPLGKARGDDWKRSTADGFVKKRQWSYSCRQPRSASPRHFENLARFSPTEEPWTSIENGLADEGLMFALAAEATPASLEDREFNKALKSLCCGPETHFEASFNTFRDRLAEGSRRSQGRAAPRPGNAHRCHPTLVSVEPREIGQRTVCKLEYLIRNFESERRLGISGPAIRLRTAPASPMPTLNRPKRSICAPRNTPTSRGVSRMYT